MQAQFAIVIRHYPVTARGHLARRFGDTNLLNLIDRFGAGRPVKSLNYENEQNQYGFGTRGQNGFSICHQGKGTRPLQSGQPPELIIQGSAASYNYAFGDQRRRGDETVKTLD